MAAVYNGEKFLGTVRPSALGDKFIPECEMDEDDEMHLEDMGFGLTEDGLWLRK